MADGSVACVGLANKRFEDLPPSGSGTKKQQRTEDFSLWGEVEVELIAILKTEP
jgi:hypothetical protein